MKSVLTESKYKQQQNKVNNLKKQANKKCYANINDNLDELKSANGKLYWKTMNMLIKNENSSNKTPPLSDPDNDFKLSYESIEKAEILNKYCSSISYLSDENKVLPDFDCRCLNVLSDIEVCERDVIDIISTLNVDKSVGHDIISNRMLLAVQNEITIPLSLLFNRSIQEMFFSRSVENCTCYCFV